jgi:hypothetical protein
VCPKVHQGRGVQEKRSSFVWSLIARRNIRA